MQLKPKLPPGRSDRKALRYGHEVRRLRAEGHTLESIRQALLDVGVSVSLSTVRREAVRPPSKWELEHAEELSLALEELPPTPAPANATRWPRQLGSVGSQPTRLTSAESGLESVEAVGSRQSVSLFTRVLGALRRLRRAEQVP